MINERQSKLGKRNANSGAPRAGVNNSSGLWLQQRFARAWQALALPRQRATVIVACSGGADSGAALALLRLTAPRLRLVACYLDHKLRPPAAIRRDIAAVRNQARFAKAEMYVCKLTGTKQRGSVEENARVARYTMLQKVARARGSRFVVTGHHADDVAETVLLALARGSGIDGAAAMPAKRKLGPSVELVRPLLFAKRDSLRALVRELGLEVSEDETNRDVRLRRNAIRTLLAALEAAVPGSSRNIARAGRLLRGDKALLSSYTAQAWEGCRRRSGSDTLTARALRVLPLPLLRRVIRHAVKKQLGTTRNFSLQHCNAIAGALKRGRGGTYHAGAARIHLSGGSLRMVKTVLPSSARNASGVQPSIPVRVRDKARIVTPFGTLAFAVKPNGDSEPQHAREAGVLRLDFASLQKADVVVRLPRPGDKCTPSGRRSLASLTRFLAKAGVPKDRRPVTPLLCAENRIAAALALRVMEPFTPKPGAPVLEARWQPVDICR